MSYPIEVIGLGSSDLDQLPLGIYRKLKQEDQIIYMRTKHHPVVQALKDEGVSFKTFDAYYEQEESFEQVYERIVQELIKVAQKTPVTYAVPGHPMLAERTVQRLLERSPDQVKIVGGNSYLDALFTALKIDPIEGFQFMDASSFKREELNYEQHIVFCQVYDYFILSHLKLHLLEDLPPDYQIVVVQAAGSEQEYLQTISLIELDRQIKPDALTSVYVPPVPKELLNHRFSRLREVIETLRGPEGCAWDRKQTHQSLRPYVIEEAYELIDAIDDEDDEGVIEELGDLLLQVMLHSQIGEDHGYFTVEDVIKRLTTKMIHRHPHVFGRDQDAHKSWDELKVEEKTNQSASILSGIPRHLPALSRALKIQTKAAKVGFDWDEAEPIWAKLQEEIEEVQEAIKNQDEAAIYEEFGDLLFVLVNLARFYRVNAELALDHCNKKFTRRFYFIEETLRENKQSPEEVSLETMDQLWEKAKERE